MPSFSLQKRFTFEAAHFLPNHEGKCRRLHGHSWVGWVELRGTHLHDDGPQTGMVLDYECISALLDPMVQTYLDHYCLNETLGLRSPTSEAVAEWVFHHLEACGLPLTSVTIQETCTSKCTYER